MSTTKKYCLEYEAHAAYELEYPDYQRHETRTHSARPCIIIKRDDKYYALIMVEHAYYNHDVPCVYNRSNEEEVWYPDNSYHQILMDIYEEEFGEKQSG
jgi:hypothetical protein